MRISEKRISKSWTNVYPTGWMLLLGVPNATCIVFTAKRGKNQSLMVFLNRDWMMIIPVLIVVGCCGWPTLRHYDAFEFIFDLIMNWNGICSMWAKCSFILLHSIVLSHTKAFRTLFAVIHTHTQIENITLAELNLEAYSIVWADSVKMTAKVMIEVIFEILTVMMGYLMR